MSPPQPFALKLRRYVPTGKVRETARLFDPENPERGKRNLNRWLSGTVVPTKVSRDRLAEILGVPDDEFALPEDEDADEAAESALASELLEIARQHAALSRKLERLLLDRDERAS